MHVTVSLLVLCTWLQRFKPYPMANHHNGSFWVCFVSLIFTQQCSTCWFISFGSILMLHQENLEPDRGQPKARGQSCFIFIMTDICKLSSALFVHKLKSEGPCQNSTFLFLGSFGIDHAWQSRGTQPLQRWKNGRFSPKLEESYKCFVAIPLLSNRLHFIQDFAEPIHSCKSIFLLSPMIPMLNVLVCIHIWTKDSAKEAHTTLGKTYTNILLSTLMKISIPSHVGMCHLTFVR